MKRLAVVGDSDIAFWPRELLPSPTSGDGPAPAEWDQTLVSGHPGATLVGILPHLKKTLAKLQNNATNVGNGGTTRTKAPPSALVVVACAGENDMGNGISLAKSVQALHDFADAIFLESDGDEKRSLVFLGPKFEPWLEDDPSYKGKYEAMSRAFRHCLDEYGINANDDTSTQLMSNRKRCSNNNENENGNQIHFIDCLTMFCGETANVPGARLGGRARADQRFFASDQLHLSKEGYIIWKEAVETKIRRCLATSK